MIRKVGTPYPIVPHTGPPSDLPLSLQPHIEPIERAAYTYSYLFILMPACPARLPPQEHEMAATACLAISSSFEGLAEVLSDSRTPVRASWLS